MKSLQLTCPLARKQKRLQTTAKKQLLAASQKHQNRDCRGFPATSFGETPAPFGSGGRMIGERTRRSSWN